LNKAMLHRFILTYDCFHGKNVHFPAEVAWQMRQVLRLRVGQTVVVVDVEGWEHVVLLNLLTRNSAAGVIQSSRQAEGDPGLTLVLYLSLTQRERFEWALQKCTEVGVGLFIPVISERTLAREKGQAQEKMDRWRRILQEAAEQSGRGSSPDILQPLMLHEALEFAPRDAYPKALLWENERHYALQTWLDEHHVDRTWSDKTIGIFVGPEGGYTEEEAEQARQAGVMPVSLGKRILRMETAAVVAAAIVLNASGDMAWGKK
jgi:16S rRNA (uracil1498-N3)-methyltransferase